MEYMIPPLNFIHLESVEKLPIEVDDVCGACHALFTRIALRQRPRKLSETLSNNIS